ncbi:hypothetical protein [uncultured Lactobacillus sp.]|uniref:hypothetical protein n=1 Tax=uncultured Lactobacillus sp. TaxID=153152 RepID=UPI0023CC9DE2|nr:hypothetical protein [uncultured Lactobacillus sp.]MDE7056131.1 hypothetical protein [Lactobacillus sp.]
MKRATSLIQKDSSLDILFRVFNRGAIVFCWISILLDIFFVILTNKIVLGVAFSFITPARYFLFDIENSKLLKRPPSLDRSIPLDIFISYWNKSFPIPQGDFFADVVGIVLAACRAFINGYALLYFDTFTFFFKVKNDQFGNPLQIVKEVVIKDDKSELKDYIKEQNEFVNETIINLERHNRFSDIDIWTFEIKRYINEPETSFFKAQEVNTYLYDDFYELDWPAYLKAHPGEKKIYINLKRKNRYVSTTNSKINSRIVDYNK